MSVRIGYDDVIVPFEKIKEGLFDILLDKQNFHQNRETFIELAKENENNNNNFKSNDSFQFADEEILKRFKFILLTTLMLPRENLSKKFVLVHIVSGGLSGGSSLEDN